MAYKHLNSYQKAFTISLIILSISLLILVFSFKFPIPYFNFDARRLQTEQQIEIPKWHDLIKEKIQGKKIKVGLVNINDDEKDKYELQYGLARNVYVKFDHVGEEKKWDDFFPEWIDEDEKDGPPKCPEIPLPSLEGYRDLDVVVARVPCDGWTGKKGMRDVFRLQVNLLVANLVVESGWVTSDVDRTVYVVFIGSCGPMQEIFRCDDLLKHVGDFWVYKPELRKLKQKVLMPFGSCQIAPPLAETGKEVWRYFMSQSRLAKLNYTTYHQREAYVTILHSSEEYVCGAISLAQSIIQSNSTKDLILLHDESITQKSQLGLKAAGWKTRLIQRIRSPFSKKNSYNEWNYSKLRVWQLIDYDKVIFIDADLLIIRNIDHLFFYPQLSAAPNNNMLFNSGVMLVEPSMCTFEDLMLKSFIMRSYNGGDQGFLNEIFTWWHRWPTKVNYLKMSKMVEGNHEQREVREGIYAIHYLGLKPWMCYRDYDCNWDMFDRRAFASDSANKRWWKVYDSMPKKLQQYCSLTKKLDARIRKWRERAKNASFPDRHWEINVRDPRRHHLVQ